MQKLANSSTAAKNRQELNACGGVAPQAFGRWDYRPHRAHGVGAYAVCIEAELERRWPNVTCLVSLYSQTFSTDTVEEPTDLLNLPTVKRAFREQCQPVNRPVQLA